ncbi:phage immunity repressor protein [Yersinia mollaretii]|uniref:Phage immunity repressor protein n=2 Tax=Yersinia mollaretii TaxID=33060 RepID=A0AA36LPR9_YERMO|nr:phage immunity repressor protein [Yersinia mollaretii]
MSQIIAISVISCQLKVSNTDAQNLNYETSVVPEASNLYQSPEYNGDYRSAKYLAQQTLLKNGNSPSLTKHEQYSGSGKEKGSTLNATLWDYSDGSALDFLRCSILSLRPQASSTHDEKLTVGLYSFSRSTLASIWSISSWGKRIPFVADLLFFALVAIKRSPLSVMTPYTNLERKKRVDVPQHLALMCPNTLLAHGVKKATPQSATNTSEASNHNVNEAYTMALQHSTQTRPKFQYLFLAVCRSDLNATPHRESITAHSEQDARRSLAGQFVLSFAGRIPAQGVCNA